MMILKPHMRSSGKWLSEFLNLKESLHKCYFEDHREKIYAPKLFNTLSMWILIIGVQPTRAISEEIIKTPRKEHLIYLQHLSARDMSVCHS
ncbi:hypothetical protein YC2023_095850 [Brassica napus]